MDGVIKNTIGNIGVDMDIKGIRQVGGRYIKVGECPECGSDVMKYVSLQPSGQCMGLSREKYRCSVCDLQGDKKLWEEFWGYKWMYDDLSD